jgi:hypothetical protein
MSGDGDPKLEKNHDNLKSTVVVDVDGIRITEHRNGIASFQAIDIEPERWEEISKSPFLREKKSEIYPLRYELHGKTLIDNGLGSIYGVLDSKEYGYLNNKFAASLISEIEKNIDKSLLPLIVFSDGDIEKHFRSKDNYEIFLRAVWVQTYAEKYGPVWLAAMAQHAYFVEHDEYTFGYLVALLDQKLENETDFLRGEKVVEGAARSNAERAAQRIAHREKVISTMRPLITEKHPSINRAARLAFENGTGKSTDANRKIYERYA